MKIAVLTDDGKTISRHFGRAVYYLVFSIQNGEISGRELREKMGHQHFSNEPHGEHPGERHGMDAASHEKHVRMTQTIEDCQVVIGGGMGMGAYHSLQRLGIRVVMTDRQEAEDAVQAYISGVLEDRGDLLH